MLPSLTSASLKGQYCITTPSPPALPHSNMNIGGIIFPLAQQSKDEDSVVYHGQYDTEGVPHTKSGDRQPVQVSIEVGHHNKHTECRKMQKPVIVFGRGNYMKTTIHIPTEKSLWNNGSCTFSTQRNPIHSIYIYSLLCIFLP